MFGPVGQAKSSSLLDEYSSLLSDAVMRHRARAAEHSARVEAEIANKMKSEFISNMSHELRTPLNTIIGFSKLLAEHEQRPLGGKEVAEYGALIHDAADHLLAIINDILEISKLQSGKYTLEKRQTNIGEILAGAVKSYQMMASEAHVDFKTDIAPDLPTTRGDPAKLRQIFMNILSNAMKFTPANGMIAVTARPSADGGVLIAIRDSGLGMSAEQIDIALTPFGQVDSSRSRWREGAGLGLPIAKALVELHGGLLELRSKKGSGTDVVMAFPADDNVNAPAPAETQSHAALTP
ncbi:HAMP domain-containing sensor histidine kinase [Hyphomicrobium sp.]|uniref:sensor histidine kinase n=1 Tax=Hyphomicrobium sp. TaxID=82 RepID=UPI0025B7EC7C|nr:HAMP domain-containing sensor histidine kinase [Hyphomicrobium sp.]